MQISQPPNLCHPFIVSSVPGHTGNYPSARNHTPSSMWIFLPVSLVEFFYFLLLYAHVHARAHKIKPHKIDLHWARCRWYPWCGFASCRFSHFQWSCRKKSQTNNNLHSQSPHKQSDGTYCSFFSGSPQSVGTNLVMVENWISHRNIKKEKKKKKGSEAGV